MNETLMLQGDIAILQSKVSILKSLLHSVDSTLIDLTTQLSKMEERVQNTPA